MAPTWKVPHTPRPSTLADCSHLRSLPGPSSRVRDYFLASELLRSDSCVWPMDPALPLVLGIPMSGLNYVPQNSYIGVLTLSTAEWGHSWKWGLHQGHQVRARPLGWALIYTPGVPVAPHRPCTAALQRRGYPHSTDEEAKAKVTTGGAPGFTPNSAEPGPSATHPGTRAAQPVGTLRSTRQRWN